MESGARGELTFRPAARADVERLTKLINSAYRGDASKAGWTTEADLLEGLRSDVDEVSSLIDEPDSLILVCEVAGEIVGSVHLRRDSGVSAHLGMFVVEPVRQAGGIGSRLMDEAERHVRDVWGCARMVMEVISVRDELIAFYERRGYRRTGELIPFPAEAATLSRLLVPRLEFAVLEKNLA